MNQQLRLMLQFRRNSWILLEIREQFQMAILLISHDMGVVARMCEVISVMYLGKIVEVANAADLFKSPKHPYTQALLNLFLSRIQVRKERVI